MRTFVNGTVGFSRRRGVALNASNSLMGVDKSIPWRPFYRDGGTTIAGQQEAESRRRLLLHTQSKFVKSIADLENGTN